MSRDAVFNFLGQVISIGGGAVAISYALFHFLAKGWIQNQLAKDLESAKSEISLLAARQLKLHDREYVVFPEVWAKLNKAFQSLGDAVISFRKIPDLQNMAAKDFDDWIKKAELSDAEQKLLITSSDKVRAYARILDFRSLSKAKEDFYKFHEYFHENRIFLSPDIKKKLEQVSDLLQGAWVDKHMDWEGHRPGEGESFLLEAWEKYDKKARPIMIEIEVLFQEKLFPNKSAS
jgi:hypothetical protein